MQRRNSGRRVRIAALRCQRDRGPTFHVKHASRAADDTTVTDMNVAKPARVRRERRDHSRPRPTPEEGGVELIVQPAPSSVVNTSSPQYVAISISVDGTATLAALVDQDVPQR
jgi:hypothetical protein